MRIGRMGVLVAFALLVVASGPANAGELDLDKIHALRDKGKELFDESANVDLSPRKRNVLRKDAYAPLTEAFKMLDAWCDEHPEDIEKLEDLICEIHQMRYWLRKESPTGLLEGKGNQRARPSDWPDKPPADLHKPALPPGESDPAPAPGGDATPVPDPGPQKSPVEEHLEFAKQYEKEHPYDLAGIRDLYLDIMEHALPGSAEYAFAIRRVSHFNGRLKEGYRLLRNEDPDTLKLSGAEERKLVHNLSKDLKNKHADVRLRAAEYLGLLGSGDGARHIVAALKREKESACVDMMFDALLKIGGSKTIEQLGAIRKWKKEDRERRAIEVLGEMIERSEIERRYASITLGLFIFSKSKQIRREAFDRLKALGPHGAMGLMNAVMVPDHDMRLEIIRALGDSGNGKAGSVLGPLLMGGVKGRARELRSAAEAALKKIGKPCVPYLARGVDHNRNGPYTRFVLREITGRHFKTGASVMAWWARNK